MKKSLIYIYGLGSDCNSRKFINIKEYFGAQFNYDFLEWNSESNIKQKLIEIKLRYKDLPLIIVGDSTGANFAYQLREMREKENENSILILTSPLLNINQKNIFVGFPEKIIPQLWAIETLQNALIIASKKDEVLNQNFPFNEKFENVKIIDVEDNHRLENFKEYLVFIDKYIQEKKFV